MSSPRHRTQIFSVALAALLLFAASCVDAPYAPEDGFVPGPLVLAPSLTLVGPSGAPAATEAQADALSEAFDLVDRFHMVVRRATNNALVVDTIIQVTPGQDSYDLSASVTTTSPDEQFLLSFTALQGQIELFSSPPMAVKATPQNTSSNSPPAPINVTLTYSGPGATAASVEIEPGVVVVGPEGTGSFTATVFDAEGSVLGGVPMSWTAASETVATVADGTVTGQADGITTIVVATPTGIQASASVYVVSGNIAYVEDGQVKVRAAGGGEAEERSSGSGASAPAWTADGGLLYYASGGSVRLAGTSTGIVDGDWPAVSPNGAYIAVEQSGQVVFANADGSLSQTGPAGTTPVWADDGTLVVGGGSIQQVDVSGSGRTTLVPGDAQFPALGPAGAVAYLSGGQLMATGSTESLASGASGRPSWSVGGTWLAFEGSEGLMVVPADGSAPAAPLPGLASASDPAWQPSSPMAAPAAPSLSGLNPDPPIPGQPVDILGSGFDRVIPANNHVFWPTPSGSEETEVSKAESGSVSTVVPRRVAAGQIRVENRAGTAVLDFVPSLGALEVSAKTPWDAGVEGVVVVLTDGGTEEVGRGETDSEGALLISGLQPGAYTVQITPPDNYVYKGTSTRSVDISTETLLLDLVLSPVVATIDTDPEELVLSVGDQVEVTLTPRDGDGNEIPEFGTISWSGGTSHLGVSGSGLSGTINGTSPTAQVGEAQFSVTLDGQVFYLGATVVSYIAGKITRVTEGGGTPAQSHGVSLEKGGTEVAKTQTDGAGRYIFDGLLGGEYTVRPAEPDEGGVKPRTATVNLGGTTPVGKADFTVEKVVEVPVGNGEVIVVGDINYWGSGSYIQSANNREMTRNFVTNGTRTKTVWYHGHDAYNKSLYSAMGYFGQTYTYITGTVGQTMDVVTTGTTGSLSIPDDAASIWFWMPQAAFDAADIAELKRYLAGGGRIILIGENNNSVFNLTNQRVQELMNALGSAGVYNDGCFSGSTSDITSDPLMADVTSIYTRCTSYFTPGDGDVALVRQSGQPIVLRLRLGAPVTLAPSKSVMSGTAALRMGTEAPVSGDPALGSSSSQIRRQPPRR